MIGTRGFGRHVAVLRPPNDERRRAVLAQICLIARKLGEVRFKLLHQPDRKLSANRRVHQRPVELPQIRRHTLGNVVADHSDELGAKALLAHGFLERAVLLGRSHSA